MKPLIILLCLCLLIIPAIAQDVTFTAPQGKCVWAVSFNIPDSSSGTITLTQANGDTTTASWSRAGVPLNTLTGTIGGDSDSFSMYPLIPAYAKIWNGDNSTPTTRQLKLGTGLISGGWSRVVITDIDVAVITSYHLTSDKQITITNELVDTSVAIGQLTNTQVDWQYYINQLITMFPTFWGIFSGAVGLLKFLFVDNIMIVIGLYILGTMAYAINTSRDIFKVLGTWFNQQVKLFDFITRAFSTSISIVMQVLELITRAVQFTIDNLLAIIRLFI